MRLKQTVEKTCVYTAVITPLTEHLSIDFASLNKLLREQEHVGNGVLILGSTGEALNLSMEQRKQIVLYTMELNLEVPVMIGIGGAQLEAQVEWIRWLNGQSVDSYLLVTPLYSKPGKEGQIQWFECLMDASERPCMLYNVPGRTGVELDPEALKSLQSHTNAWAVKEAGGCAEKLRRYIQQAPSLRFFCGDDILIDEFIEAGATGLISVASNTWPEITQRLVQQLLQNRRQRIPEEFRRAAQSLFLASNPVPVKALLFELGIINSPLMLPPLSHEDLYHVGPVLASHTQLMPILEELRQQDEKELGHAVA
tara:strand:- start:457 stop:1389 length:933 start_codon:yes stop_codon:yes gene_type:complete